jgi:hypothetical protein
MAGPAASSVANWATSWGAEAMAWDGKNDEADACQATHTEAASQGNILMEYSDIFCMILVILGGLEVLAFFKLGNTTSLDNGPSLKQNP